MQTQAFDHQQAKAHLRSQGKTIKQFAAEHGFPLVQVYRVMNGTIKATRGKSHEIAKALQMK